jgi:tyrosyl-tRNA synthetase
VHLPAALAAAFGLSTSEARRLIGQGGVKLAGEVVRELDVARAKLRNATVQAGKRRFTRFREPS